MYISCAGIFYTFTLGREAAGLDVEARDRGCVWNGRLHDWMVWHPVIETYAVRRRMEQTNSGFREIVWLFTHECNPVGIVLCETGTSTTGFELGVIN